MHFDILTAMLVTSALTLAVGASLAVAVSRYPDRLRHAMHIWIGGLLLQIPVFLMFGLVGALPGQRLVDRDAGEPGGQGRSPLEPADRREGLEIGALHRILRLRPVAENGEDGAEETLVVARRDEPNRPRVFRGEMRCQFQIGQILVIEKRLRGHVSTLLHHWMPDRRRRSPKV